MTLILQKIIASRRFKSLLLIVSIVFSCSYANAQVIVNGFPKDLQLFPRTLSTNKSGVPVYGTVALSTNYTELHLKRYRNGSFQINYVLSLFFFAGSANFGYTDSIPAELANYKYELYGFKSSDNSETLIQTADNIVGGDVYIIQGQSNAEAQQRSGSAAADNNNFIRVYGSGYDSGPCADAWFVGQSISDRNSNGNTGQWGLRMANLICTTYGIPVCILNGAHPGQPISFFERNDGNTTDINTNYGRLLRRTQLAVVQNNIRAILFYQGESDANIGTTLASYKTQFYDLYNDWKSDFPGFKKLYLFQTRFGCWPGPAAALQIQQAHKELTEENPADITIISTNNSTQISESTVGYCHYGYANGYKLFGERAFYLMQKDLYAGGTVSNTESPYPLSALLVGSTQISISLKNTSDSYTADIGVASDFALIGSGTYSIISVSISGSNLIVNFTGTGAAPTGISFSAHSGNSSPSVYNSKAIGLISFYNLAVSPTTLPIDKIVLTAIKQTAGIAVKWIGYDNENIASYELERSDNPLGFYSVYSIASKTTIANAPATYDYFDNNPGAINYYRVKARKLNGSIVYSAVIVVNTKNSKEAGLAIYPNPFNESATISFKATLAELALIKILDEHGVIVFQQQVNCFQGVNYIALHPEKKLPHGIYLLECIAGEGLFSEKIIVQ